MLRVFRIVAALILAVSGAQSQIAATGKISGRVVLPDGSPIEGVRVAALTAETAETRTDSVLVSIAETDREGHYRLEAIPPGRYYLVAGPLDAPVYFPGFTVYSADHVAGGSKASATVITVTSGTALADRDIRLKGPLTLRVSGRVLREGHRQGNAIFLNVAQDPRATITTLSATIAPDGSFTFPSVRPGTYQIRVAPNLDRLAPMLLTVKDRDITGWEIPIPLEAISDVPARLTLTVEGGGPLPRFSHLQLTWVGPPPKVPLPLGALLTGQGGQFAMLLPDSASKPTIPVGEYLVDLPHAQQQLPAGYSIKSIVAGGVDLLKETLKAAPTGIPPIEVTLTVSSPSPWVKVRGKVTGMNPSSARVQEIKITTNALLDALTTTVNADGSFEFPAVLPGTYQAQLTPPVDTFVRSLIVPTTEVSDAEIPMVIQSLTVGGRTDIEKARGLFVSVLLQSVQEGFQPPVISKAVGVEADGSFSFGPVQPGHYTVRVSVCRGDVCGGSEGAAISVVDRDITDLFLPLTNPFNRN